MNKQNRKKRVLFDMNHPADFHFFKHLIIRMLNQDYTLLIVARDKECLHDLLDDAGIPYQSRGSGKHSLAGKYIFALLILCRLLYYLLRFRPGLTLSLSSPYLALLTRLLGIPCITFDDTDENPRLLPLIRLSKYLFSPATYPHQFHSGHFHLPVYKELAYLHPSLFRFEGKRTGVFFRITRTDSVHHSLASRLNLDTIIERILQLNKVQKVIVSSELNTIADSLCKSRQANPTNVHKDLAICKVFWGNSATMAAEAAVLGIPAVFVGAEKFAYIKELEKQGLLFHFHPENLDLSLNKLDMLLKDDPPGDQFAELRQQLLNEKIDMTSFMAWFIETLPESAHIMKEQPDYVLRFISGQSE